MVGSFFRFLASLATVVLLWSVAGFSGTKERPFQTYRLDVGGVRAAALSPDGSRVAFIIGKGVLTKTGIGNENFDDLQVWDIRTKRIIFERKKVWDLNVDGSNLGRSSESPFLRSLNYTPDGREIVYGNGMLVRVFEASDYLEVRRFSITPPPMNGRRWEPGSLVLSPDGRHIAVLALQQPLDKGLSSTGSVALRVYSAGSGNMEHEWTLEKEATSIGQGLCWSPDGTELATTLYPMNGEFYAPGFLDLRIVEVSTDNLKHEIHTGHWADEVAFAGDNQILTVSRDPAFGVGRKEGIRIWGVETGKLIGEIRSPPDGVHKYVRVSEDGRVVLGYIGKDRRNENFADTAEQRFRLWDSASWTVLFTSSPISGPLDATSIRFALSPRGNVVLVWWEMTPRAPVYIYEVQ
jgi:WD40 repeat protein